MVTLKRLELTEEIRCRLALVARARELAGSPIFGYSKYELAKIELADVITAAVEEQSLRRLARVPTRPEPAAVVEVRMTPKRRRRA